MEKVTVKVTKEVAEAIESLRSGVQDYGYWRSIRQFEERDSVDARFVKTRAYFNEDVALFTRAMLGEYEIVKSPEERIKAKFAEQRDIHSDLYVEDMTDTTEYAYADGYMTAIRDFAEIYGISIKGVNA